MAIQHIAFPEWRDSHDASNYPFTAQATLVNESGDTLFAETFLDAMFYPMGAQIGGYLSRVRVTADQVTLTVGDSATPDRASSTFSRVEAPDEIRFTSSGLPAGVIVSETGRLAIFGAWAEGTYEFLPEQTEFVARVWAPTPHTGVRGIQVESGEILTGDILLVGGDGVILSCDTITLDGPCGAGTILQEVIRVDIVGDPLWSRQLCEDPASYSPPRFLETVTFCRPSQAGLIQECVTCGPSPYGDMKITAGSQAAEDTILRIRAVGEGLVVETVGETLEDIR